MSQFKAEIDKETIRAKQEATRRKAEAKQEARCRKLEIDTRTQEVALFPYLGTKTDIEKQGVSAEIPVLQRRQGVREEIPF